MSIPTPARTPAQSQTRSHGTPVPPGTAGLWIATGGMENAHDTLAPECTGPEARFPHRLGL